MRRLSANYIYPVNKTPLKNGIVEISDDGKVQTIIDTKGELKESRNLEFYNGVITPGFVNTHCHLELSGQKGKFKQNAGLPNFLKEVINYRNQGSSKDSFKAIELYDGLMRQNGIVAVGDISNTDLTITTKIKSEIYYHSFIEATGLGINFNEVFKASRELFNGFLNNNLSVSIVPHASYSVSKELFHRIKEFSEINNSIVSIHNQESDSERQFFMNKSGGLVETFSTIGVDLNQWKPTGKNSIESIIDRLPKNNNIIFVHNTFSNKKDVDLINDKVQNAYWCLCPLSNLYIEDKLPDFDIFNQFSDNVTLGTDSLASNTTLSILDEMKTIVKNYNKIDFEKLIRWGTLNGAKALQIDKNYGSIEKWKTPGLNLISNFDFEKMQITGKSEIKVLV
ncbi:MAG: amidohydrolase family protein [Bacteroidales bacterium]|nr:amidohydrolase family protein [Bacteroidales bacterium]